MPDPSLAAPPDSSALLADLLRSDAAQLRDWCAQAHAAQWGFSADAFASELARCVNGKFHALVPSYDQLRSHIGTLRLQDLALASACSHGLPDAWESFVATYRPYLRAAAAAMLKRPASSPEAQDLADSLFADLYGFTAEKRGQLFRYFHGRSSLKTWLRAVLAQRHIDKIRASRKFEELPEVHPCDPAAAPLVPAPSGPSAQPPDPHRERYLRLFSAALHSALQNLDLRDAQRLRMYYAEEKKLAEIGSALGEHESSSSRNLERLRRELRVAVEKILKSGGAAAPPGGQAADGRATDAHNIAGGLSDAQIALCYQYAAEDPPIDLDALLPQPETPPAAGGQRHIVNNRAGEPGKHV